MVGAPSPDASALKKVMISPAPKPTFDLEKIAVAPAPKIAKQEMIKVGGPASIWKGYGTTKSVSMPMRGMSVGLANPFAMRRDVHVDMRAPVKMYSSVSYGGAAAKLLPETVKEENEDDKGAPLLNDND